MKAMDCVWVRSDTLPFQPSFKTSHVVAKSTYTNP